MMTIATAIGVSVSTVHRDLTICRQNWRLAMVQAFDEIVAEQLAKIDAIEEEAWAAWRRSQNDRAETTVSLEYEGGATPDSPDAQASGSKAVTKTRENVGEERFLARIAWCVEQRVKLAAVLNPQTPSDPMDEEDATQQPAPDRGITVSLVAAIIERGGAEAAPIFSPQAVPGAVRGDDKPWSVADGPPPRPDGPRPDGSGAG